MKAHTAFLMLLVACLGSIPQAWASRELASAPVVSPAGICEKYLSERDALAQHITESHVELARLFSHAEEQSRNWKAFLNGKTESGARVHVLHQTGIKDLNENLWNITGSEEYLEAFHDLLHQFLKTNTAFGAVLHNDYKNHFVASNLTGPEFRQLVLEPVVDRLIKRMSARKTEVNWDAWVRQTIFHGEGETPAKAYFQVGAARARHNHTIKNMTHEQWQAEAVARRTKLQALAAEAKIDWNTLLVLLHKRVNRTVKDEVVLRRWLRLRTSKVDEIMTELKLYADDLQIADFLPLPEATDLPESFEKLAEARSSNPFSSKVNWAVERRALFAQIKSSRYVVVTDVEGLGGIARRFQDRWVGKGGKLEELQSVYTQSTLALESYYLSIHSKMKGEIGENAEIHMYVTGDDAVFFLPEMSAKAKDRVSEILREAADIGDVPEEVIRLKLHSSKLIELDASKDQPTSVADGLMRARDSLFASKKKKK